MKYNKSDTAIRLERLRKDKQLTQSEAAEKLGVSRSTYNCYETDRVIPPVEVLIRIADFYHVSTDYILGLSPEKNPAADEIAKRLKLLAAVAQDMDSISYSEFLGLINALIGYYHTRQRAGNMPMKDARSVIAALTTVVEAASADSLSTLHQAVNNLALTALNANDIITEYIK